MRCTTAVCLTLGTAIATGCSADRSCGGPCGTVVITVTGAAETALPLIASSVPAQAIGDLLFLPLAEIGTDLNYVRDDGFEPKIARRWSFEDSVTIVFDVDPRAVWQDGQPVTAHDVAFTFDLYRDPVINSVVRTDLGSITSVTARDNHTVAFVFSHAYPEQFYDAVHHMRIHPRHLLDTIPRMSIASHPFTRSPIGNGPYRLVRWDANASIELHADTTFFLGRPGLDRIVVQVTESLNTILTQLIAEEADFTDFLGPPANVERVQQTAHLDAVPIPSLTYLFLSFNFRDPNDPAQPHPLFSRAYVRQAVSMAIDREAITQATMSDFGSVPQGPVSLANPLWTLDVAVIPYDTSQARQVLAGQGWSDTDGDGVLDRDGNRLSFTVIYPGSSGLRRQIATIMERQLQGLGIELRLEPLEFPTWLSRSSAGRFDATLGGWEQDPNPLGSIRGAWGSDGPNNWGRYTNPHLDAILDAIGQGLASDLVNESWKEALEVIQHDYPAVWLMSPVQAMAVHTRFDNVTMRPGRWGASMWKWRVRPGQMLPRDRVGIR